MQHPSGSSEPLTPFHVAVQVRDIAEARAFYKDILGCSEGRSDTAWVDFSLFGHQFVCHLNPALGKGGSLARSSLAERLKRMGVRFAVETGSGTSAQA